MSRKKLVIGLLVLLAILLGGLTYLYYRSTQPELNPTHSGTNPPPLIEWEPFKPGDIARMNVFSDQSKVAYEVDGEFDTKPTIFGDYLSVDFIIAGDQSRQPIRLLLGPTSSTILTGRDRSESSDVTKIVWSKLTAQEFVAAVPIRQPVTIHLLYYPGEANDIREINKYKQFWKDVNSQIITTDTFVPPQDIGGYWFYSAKVRI
jgi:hypothetical protein